MPFWLFIYLDIYGKGFKIFTFLYEVHFHTLTVLSAFVIYFMCDGSIASIAPPIISFH